MKEILTNYLDKRLENQNEQEELKASGWSDYLKHISWIDNEPIIYKINHRFEVTTEQINKVLDWAEKYDISNDFVLQLFFDWATKYSDSDVDGLLYETNIYAPKVRLASFKLMPKSPELLSENILFGQRLLRRESAISHACCDTSLASSVIPFTSFPSPQ